MNKSFATFRHTASLLVAALLLLASCHNEGTEEMKYSGPATGRTVLFEASQADTKAAFGQGEGGVYPTFWTENDTYVKLALGYSSVKEASVIASEDFRHASFAADFDFAADAAPYVFYAVSPASAAKTLSESRKAWSISIPAVQTPLDSSVDEAAMIIAASSSEYDSAPEKVNMHFSHLTAYGRLSFENLELGGATVSKIEITATAPFVGDWYWNCSSGHEFTDNGASSTLTINTSKTSDIWFACAPVDMSGQIAVVTVYTDQGSFVKEIEFPAGRRFTSGRIAVIKVDMNGIEPLSGSDSFVLVKDASQLCAGDQIIIANKSGNYAMGEQYSDKYRQRVQVKTESETMTDIGSATVFTLVAGVEGGTWALQAENGKYLSTRSSGNNLTEKDGIDSFSSWTFDITSTGEATITAGSGLSNIIRENSGSPRFSAYGTGSNLKDPVTVYRKGSSGAPAAEDPMESNFGYGIYQGNNTRIYVPGTDQYCRQYSDSGVLTFTILEPESKEQVEITGYRNTLVKGDKLTITVNWRKGRSSVLSGTTYSVKVVKEEGPRVWLGDGSGKGFIIKK